MTIKIEKVLEEAEPIEQKSIGRILGTVTIPAGLESEQTPADIFGKNAVLFKYKNGSFNVLVMNSCVTIHGKKPLLAENNPDQTIYFLFEQPVSEQEARIAYRNLNAIQ
ncbi:MAG: hypothetical protein AABX79_00275 [Nanoarchaeota archaeon]